MTLIQRIRISWRLHRQRRNLPFRLPFVWWAKSRWLPALRHKDCWEILLPTKDKAWKTWVVYDPCRQCMWAEDVDCSVWPLDAVVCESLDELQAYINWTYYGRPTAL